jgi:alpha-ketoglutarate-dependent sulfate ester dioxygenase
MAALKIEPLTPTVGAEVLDVETDRLLTDELLPDAVLDALETNGVLVFRDLHLDDATQVQFCRRLGEPHAWADHAIPEITVISLDPAKTAIADYLRATFDWHLDGTTDEVPNLASVLTAHVLPADGGQTDFANTYAAYDRLSAQEKEAYSGLRVLHTFEASQRRYHPDPGPEVLAAWESRPQREHPLVWKHRSARKSLVLGATADYVVGWDLERGRALLDDLLARATAPELVYRHEWAVGDTVIWDNRGVLHRVCPYDVDSQREMHRTTILGDEPIL